MSAQHDLVRMMAVRYLELSESNIDARTEEGRGWMLACYEFVRNVGASTTQLHEAAKMLRREILNLDKMLGGQ